MKLNKSFFSLASVLILFLTAVAFVSKPAVETSTATQAKTVLDKLVGTWQSKNGRSFERWSKNSDGSFKSAAFRVKGSDTSWTEMTDIYPQNDKWIFETTVKGQNDGRAVKFTSSIFTGTTVQFSNPAHDFPTDVNYTLKDDNTLNAFIVGPNNKGGKDTILFNYTRLK